MVARPQKHGLPRHCRRGHEAGGAPDLFSGLRLEADDESVVRGEVDETIDDDGDEYFGKARSIRHSTWVSVTTPLPTARTEIISAPRLKPVTTMKLPSWWTGRADAEQAGCSTRPSSSPVRGS